MHNLLSNHMILPLEVRLGDMRCFRNPRLRWSPRTTFRLDAGFVARRRPRDSPILSLTFAAARPSPRPPWACFRRSRGRPPAAPACSLCHSGPPPRPRPGDDCSPRVSLDSPVWDTSRAWGPSTCGFADGILLAGTTFSGVVTGPPGRHGPSVCC